MPRFVPEGTRDPKRKQGIQWTPDQRRHWREIGLDGKWWPDAQQPDEVCTFWFYGQVGRKESTRNGIKGYFWWQKTKGPDQLQPELGQVDNWVCS